MGILTKPPDPSRPHGTKMNTLWYTVTSFQFKNKMEMFRPAGWSTPKALTLNVDKEATPALYTDTSLKDGATILYLDFAGDKGVWAHHIKYEADPYLHAIEESFRRAGIAHKASTLSE